MGGLTPRFGLFSPGKDTRLGWLRSGSGWVRKISPPPWFQPRTVKPCRVVVPTVLSWQKQSGVKVRVLSICVYPSGGSRLCYLPDRYWLGLITGDMEGSQGMRVVCVDISSRRVLSVQHTLCATYSLCNILSLQHTSSTLYRNVF